MAKTKHDSKVKQTANKLKREGWKVEADIPGYEQPDPIGQGNFIPDVQAELDDYIFKLNSTLVMKRMMENMKKKKVELDKRLLDKDEKHQEQETDFGLDN